MEEFDQRIAYAIEYNLLVKVIFWSDSFTSDITGRVHFVNSINYQLRIESETGEFHRISFKDVVGIAVLA
ncbi:YolD-like family protein [Neobacillus sp. PS3-40]|uniref:YolD-like family protein n=1 Tax=Neobacillus sp. PS3-40 TaxID=3070679 RepID=UPI0035A979B0